MNIRRLQSSLTFAGFLTAGVLTFLITPACNNSDFAGSGGNKSSANGADAGDAGCGDAEDCAADEGPSGNPGECVTGDFVKFKYRPEVQACIDEGKMWHFGTNECTKMKKASFECNFSDFVSEMQKRNMQATEKMQQGIDGKGLIVGCGESDDGQTILLQWFMTDGNNDVDCKSENPTGTVISGCYGKDGKDPTGLSQEEVDAIVNECMNKNAG